MTTTQHVERALADYRRARAFFQEWGPDLALQEAAPWLGAAMVMGPPPSEIEDHREHVIHDAWVDAYTPEAREKVMAQAIPEEIMARMPSIILASEILMLSLGDKSDPMVKSAVAAVECTKHEQPDSEGGPLVDWLLVMHFLVNSDEGWDWHLETIKAQEGK